MITDFKRFSRKTTGVALALFISICFMSLVLSCASKIKHSQTMPEPGSGSAYMLKDLDTPPRVIKAAAPMYPYEAAKNKITGRVVVKLVVTKEGTAADPVVVNSSPEGVFDAAAIEAVKKYQFKPGTIGGKNVDCIVRLPIVFSIRP